MTERRRPVEPHGSAAPLRIAPPRRLRRRGALLLTGVISLAFVLSMANLASTIRADERDGAPGGRTDPGGVLIGALAPPINADVADFEGPPLDGELGSIEHGRKWRLDQPSWSVADGLAAGTPKQGVPALATTTSDPSTYLLQVDMLDPEPGSGLVFRYRSAADHWRLVLDATEEAWVVERVTGDDVVELGRFPKRRPRFETIGVWVDGNRITLATKEGPQVQLRAEAGDPADRVGMISTGQTTRFDNFAIED